MTFWVASCIIVPDPIFAWLCFAKFGAESVLDPYNLTCWQLTPLHYTDVLSWMTIFHLVVNENDFSVPFVRHILLKSHDIILHASFRWHHNCHYEKLEHVIVMITWSWKSYHVTSAENNVANPLIFYMSMLRDISPWYSQTHLKEKLWLLPWQEIWKFISTDTGTK